MSESKKKIGKKWAHRKKILWFYSRDYFLFMQLWNFVVVMLLCETQVCLERKKEKVLVGWFDKAGKKGWEKKAIIQKQEREREKESGNGNKRKKRKGLLSAFIFASPKLKAFISSFLSLSLFLEGCIPTDIAYWLSWVRNFGIEKQMENGICMIKHAVIS